MKYFIVVFYILAFFYTKGQAQPLSDDSVVCIVDTTKSYVNYLDNPYQTPNRDYQFPPHWEVVIDGTYYKGREKRSAFVAFKAGLWGGVDGVKGFPREKVSKKSLEKRFTEVNDAWINKRKDVSKITDKIGFAPFDKYNFIIFSQDYYDNSDSVTMHRVEIMIGIIMD